MHTFSWIAQLKQLSQVMNVNNILIYKKEMSVMCEDPTTNTCLIFIKKINWYVKQGLFC